MEPHKPVRNGKKISKEEGWPSKSLLVRGANLAKGKKLKKRLGEPKQKVKKLKRTRSLSDQAHRKRGRIKYTAYGEESNP